MNLHRARVFNSVAKHQNVVMAATELCISQPAVSNDIRRFQEECGVQLFEKNGRGIKLTEDGLTLYEQTQNLFFLENQIDALLDKLRSKNTNIIHLGLVGIYERFELPSILNIFSQYDNSINVAVHSGNTKMLLEYVASRKIDMAFVGDYTGYDDFLCKPYKKHKMYMVIPKTHRLYGKKIFTPDDIRYENMVLKEFNSSSRMSIEPYLKKYNIQPVVIAELSNFDALYNIAIKENCLTFFPDMAVNSIPSLYDNCSIAIPSDCELSYSTYIITNPLNTYSLSVKLFLRKFMSSTLPSINA